MIRWITLYLGYVPEGLVGRRSLEDRGGDFVLGAELSREPAYASLERLVDPEVLTTMGLEEMTLRYRPWILALPSEEDGWTTMRVVCGSLRGGGVVEATGLKVLRDLDVV